jgi:hypothetical protein
VGDFLDEVSLHFKAEVSSKNTYHFRHYRKALPMS